MVKIGFIGTGYIANVYADVISKIKDAKIIAAVDKVEDKVKIFAKKYGAIFYNNYEEMLKNRDIDTVAICTPTFLHSEIFNKAAVAKKNIFCDKPMTLSVKEADQMIEVAKINGIKAMVGHVLRFWPEYVKIKNIIESRELGEPLFGACDRLTSTPDWDKDNWNRKESLGGGVALDVQIHDLDFLMACFGEPKLIKSQGVYNENLGGWMYMSTNVEFENGKSGVVQAARGFPGTFPFTMLVRILCENGAIEWINRGGRGIAKAKSQKRAPITIYRVDKKDVLEDKNQADPYFLEWQYFINSINKNKKIEVATLEEGRNALKAALATMRSAKNKVLVKL